MIPRWGWGRIVKILAKEKERIRALCSVKNSIYRKSGTAVPDDTFVEGCFFHHRLRNPLRGFSSTTRLPIILAGLFSLSSNPDESRSIDFFFFFFLHLFFFLPLLFLSTPTFLRGSHTIRNESMRLSNEIGMRSCIAFLFRKAFYFVWIDNKGFCNK